MHDECSAAHQEEEPSQKDSEEVEDEEASDAESEALSIGGQRRKFIQNFSIEAIW